MFPEFVTDASEVLLSTVDAPAACVLVVDPTDEEARSSAASGTEDGGWFAAT